MTISQMLKRLQQAEKVLKGIAGVAGAAVAASSVIRSSLPTLPMRRARRISPGKSDAQPTYAEVVAQLRDERAAHEQTRAHLRWATKEIENVKEAMYDWQKRALQSRHLTRRQRSRRGKRSQ